MNKANIIVLIPYYNELDGLCRSLESIKEKLPVDVVIVDDGSKTKPDEIYLRDRYQNINNITLLTLLENKGIENALNEGLKFIKENQKYEYVARLDAGDTCLENRLSIQYTYLEENPEVYLVGAGAICVDLNGNCLYSLRHKTKHKSIKRRMFIQNMFVHPAVMFRVKAIDLIGFYPIQYKYAEDYAYFFRFIKNFKVANIPEPLIKYEINPKGISMRNRKHQVKSRIRVILANWEWRNSAVIGLLYNIILYVMPLSILQNLKKIKYLLNGG